MQKRILYILEYLLFYTEPMNSIRQRFSILNTPPARKGEEIKAKILHSREIWAYSNQCVCRNLSFPKITLPSGSSEGNFMWVQVPSSAPKENGLLGIIPKSPFSFDFMRQNRLISFLSHELDVKKHFGFRRKFVTLCVINSQKQMRFLHSCKDEFC